MDNASVANAKNSGTTSLYVLYIVELKIKSNFHFKIIYLGYNFDFSQRLKIRKIESII